MRNILKYSSRLVISGGIFCSLLLGGCELNYENTGAINPDNVWKDRKMILAYLTDIHGSMMPGWPYGSSNDTDEGMKKATDMGDWARGINGVEKSGHGLGGYGNIDKINFLLDKLETVPTSILSETENKQIKGQALFWRAWDYFGKIKNIGGVPLILKPQKISDMEALFVPRNKTSECIEQIVKDLDEAISYLPDTWSGDNYGRIDKGAAMAVKGRVLLWWASPVFNPTNIQQRWKDAYDANKEAVTFLTKVGKGLYPDYKKLWYDERNKEVVMLNQFYYSDHSLSQHQVRPEPLTKDDANYDQPILSLLLAYPQKDGSPMRLDVQRLGDASYNADFLERFLNNRDDRFYTTIFCGGTRYPSNDDASGGVLTGGQKYWCTWQKLPDGSYMSMINSQLNKGVGDGVCGFHSIKGIDESLDRISVFNGETDWIEIRFAEVLMNYGECANEVNASDEALDVLYQIRKRAGISEGADKRYGITATTQNEIREAYINERFIEFAFEGKRGGDLRRWKRWDILNNMKHRQGLYIVINDNNDLKSFDWHWDIRDKEVMKKFHVEYIDNLGGTDTYTFNYDLNHWFWPISRGDIEKNAKIQQNKEWGGTFDPLD